MKTTLVLLFIIIPNILFAESLYILMVQVPNCKNQTVLVVTSKGSYETTEKCTTKRETRTYKTIEGLTTGIIYARLPNNTLEAIYKVDDTNKFEVR